MTHRELAYQKICFVKRTDLFRLLFKNVGSTKNTFDSHGSGVNIFIIADACRRAAPPCINSICSIQAGLLFFVIVNVQCLALVSYNDLIVLL